jgi:hypothetical protein
MNIGIAEHLEKISNEKTVAARVKSLKKVREECPHVFSTLKYIFKSSIIFNLPAGNDVPFKPTMKEHDLQNVLKANFRMLKNYLTGENPDWPKFKRETSFIGFLESLDPDDAKLVIGMKDKVCIYKNITKDLVKKAFPDETKDW